MQAQKDNIRKNIFAVLLYQITALGFGILIPNLILNRYGSVMHGLTSTVTNLAQYIILINAGIVNVSMNALYKPFAAKDYNRINEVANAVRRCNNKMGTLSFALIVGLSVVLSVLIRTDGLTYSVVFLMCFVVGMQQVLERYLVCTYQILVQSDQRTYIIYLVNSVVYLLRGCLQILLIVNGTGLIVVQMIPTLMIVVSWFLLRIYVKKNYLFLDPKVEPDRTVIRSRKYALPHTVTAVCVNNSSSLILSAFCNQTAVSIYAVYNLVVSHLHGFIVTVLSRSALTSTGKSVMTDTREQILAGYQKTELVFCMAVAFAYSVCSNMLIPFVKLYTAGQDQVDYINYPLLFLIILYGILNGLREPYMMMMDAAAYYKKTQWGAIIELILNIAFSTLGTVLFGVSGVLIGLVISFLFRYIYMVLVVNRDFFQNSVKKSFRRGIQTIAYIAVLFACINQFADGFVNGWLSWLLTAMAVSLLCFTLMLVMFFITDGNDVKQLLRSIICKGRK